MNVQAKKMKTLKQAIIDRGLQNKRAYRPDPFAVERGNYHGTSTARLSNIQVESAAKRFEDDGEAQNAAEMRALKK